jgi:hypothetical protein
MKDDPMDDAITYGQIKRSDVPLEWRRHELVIGIANDGGKVILVDYVMVPAREVKE